MGKGGKERRRGKQLQEEEHKYKKIEHFSTVLLVSPTDETETAPLS